MELEEVRWVVRFSRQTSLGQHPCNLQEQMTWEKKLYDAFLLSLQDPKLTFWFPVFTKVSYGIYIAITEEKATILMELLLQNDSEV